MTAPTIPAAVVKPAQTFFGLVVGAKQMQKTIKVRVAKTKMHPVVLKPVTTHKNFLVHDGAEQCVVGDWVRIDSCRKFSKNKNFTLGEIVKPASRFFEQETGILHSQASVNAAANTRRSVIEKREQDLRRQQFQREDLIKQLQQDDIFRKNLDSDERVENKRRLYEQRQRDEEEKTHKSLVENERLRRERQIRAEQELQIVEELKQQRNDEIREEKLRQSIRKNSVELRDLEKKLNYAYMNKERALQIQEKQLHLQKEQLAEADAIREMNRKLEIENQKAFEAEKRTYEKSVAYQHALQSQLVDFENRKLDEYEQFLKEKAMVDAIVAKILEEDEKELQKRLEKQRETKQFIEDYLAERERWRESEHQRVLAENRKIEEYAYLQNQREQNMKEKRKNMDDEKNIIYDRLASEMARQEREKAELEQLRIDLYQEEEEERARNKDQELLRTRIRKRLEMIDAYQMQVEDKRQRLEKHRADEAEFRRKMMEKFAHDEQLEQLNAQRRRMKQLEHKRAVDALVEERRKLIQQEYARQVEDHQREKMLEEYRQQVIEQERQRMLHEHASHLLGYLPKGVIRDERDLALFDEEFRRKFEGTKIHD
ncbi:mannosyl-oligosaccharide alpha-1,2-mannosidase [Rhizoclosmatium sp. JEL0117]|nr:mannosyl-oligosaccharide alpha-1,2-mannosidase [Rhizoclosmatium sp. JEL0117]